MTRMTNAGFRLCSIATPRCDRPTIHSTLDHCYFFVTFSFSFILFSEAASRITSFPLFPFFFFYFQPEERSYWHERSNPSFSSFLPFFLPPSPFFPSLLLILCNFQIHRDKTDELAPTFPRL